MPNIVFPTDLKRRILINDAVGEILLRRNSEERIWLAKYTSENARLVRGEPLIPRK